MKKINFVKDVLPHLAAVGIFLIVTFFFFNPVFFDHKVISQGDIQQWEGSSKATRAYREAAGKEPLWTDAMFSGMPAYLVNVEWGNKVVGYVKTVMALKLPHPVANIFLAFVCYYIMLLTFGVRPYLAIGGAIAFGLSSYMIMGLGAGHNARLGAVAFMPLVIAGIHLAFSKRLVLGFGVTTTAMALHFRENHLQITYYMLLIVAVYGLIRLIQAVKEKETGSFLKTVGVLAAAVAIAVGTFFGPMWAITEYTRYSTRGEVELTPPVKPGTAAQASGLDKERAFMYSNSLMEPMSLLLPDFYGNYSNYLVADNDSKTREVLSRSTDEQMANQLQYYSSEFWGDENSAAYYAGAVIMALFVVGLLFADKKYVWWLASISVVAVLLSWGKTFPAFNYLVFDYLPGYNKFRSVTFAMVMIIFAAPLLGFLGLEKILGQALTPAVKKKLLIGFGITAGLCVIFWMFGGMLGFTREGEEQLPNWFLNALVSDRKAAFRADAFRSLLFVLLTGAAVYFEIWKRISPVAFYAFLITIITIDVAMVDNRYLRKEQYQRKQENAFYTATAADESILQDESVYRVYNISPGAFTTEAHTSYYHNSIGGYHGAKLRRYQDLYDSCLFKETNELITDAQGGRLALEKYGVINMLNVKYLTFGPDKNNVIPNPQALGNAWFVDSLATVKGPNDELATVCQIDTRHAAVIDESKFAAPAVSHDSTATIALTDHNPNYRKYESQSDQNGLAVFSEIYYPKGWKATIDGNEAPILRANYVLRALAVPAGKHTIEFRFEPAAYKTGNTITTASSWVMLPVLLGTIAYTLKDDKAKAVK